MEKPITRIGQIIKISGGSNIILHPQQTYPLEGYIDRYDDDFFKELEQKCKIWFTKFPNCCEKHKRFSKTGNYKKEKLLFVEKMIENNVKYFLHSLEKFIIDDNWYEEISQYYEYLYTSFGSPGIGNHIFLDSVTYIIVNYTINGEQLPQERKNELLHLVYFIKKIEDQEHIEELYSVFKKWVNYIPSLSKLEKIKKELSELFPMDLFLSEVKYNKYLGLSKFSIKQTGVFVADLEIMTKSILHSVNDQVKEEGNKSNTILIKLSEEKLRFKQEILLGTNIKSFENGYIKLMKDWVEIWVEYFKEIGPIIEQDNYRDFINEILFNFDVLRNQSNDLEVILRNLLEGKQKLITPIKYATKKIESALEAEGDEKSVQLLWDNLRSEMLEKTDLGSLVNEIDNADLSIKKKIKVSFPLFLFTKYEAEIEIGKKVVLPQTLQELKKIFFK